MTSQPHGSMSPTLDDEINAAWSEVNKARRDALTWRRRYETLAEDLDEYRLWEPGRKGHAAAHRQLYSVLEETDPNANL